METKEEVETLRSKLALVMEKMRAVKDLSTPVPYKRSIDVLEREEIVWLTKYYSGIIDLAVKLLTA